MRDLDYGFGPYLGHPADPRTPEYPDRDEWEADTPYLSFLDASAVEEILCELLHGDPAVAKRDLDRAVEAAFQQSLEADDEP